MLKRIIMKKIAIIPVIIMFLASCSSNSEQDKLKELKQQRNDLQTELEKVNQQITEFENNILDEGGTLTQRNITEVKISPAAVDTFNHFVSSQGEVISDNNIFVPVESPGVVNEVYVDEGDDVSKGQKIAQIDASIIKKQIDELKNGLEFATDVFQRRKRLWDKNIGSEIEYLQAKNQKEDLEKKLATTMEQLDKLTIKAPIAGTVDEVFLKEGEMAPAGFQAARILKLSDMNIKAELSESYINKIKKGNKVVVKPINGFKEYTSEVITVAKAINDRSRTFTVEIALPGDNDQWTPNMITSLEILNYTNEQAITVPVNVIQKTQNKQFLFVAQQNGDKWVASKKWIETGLSYNNRTEIISGLKADDKVITAGYQGLSDGVEISVKNM